MDNVRLRMLRDEVLPECAGCNSRNQSTSIVERDMKNTMFANVIPELVNNTDPNTGALLAPFRMRFMNIRYSNFCNFSCRTCGADNSSLWAQEMKHEHPVVKIVDTISNYLKEIDEYLHTIEAVNFAGGESMFIPEHWDILDRLLAIGQTGVVINYTTNLSKLTFKGKDIIEYAKKFSNFRIIGSIDCIHDRAVVYRHGTDWNDVEHSLRRIQDNNVNILVNCTIGAMNIWHVPDVERYLIENHLMDTGRFNKVMLVYSPFLSSKILPNWYKEEVTAKIRTHQQWLLSINKNPDSWDDVIHFMNSESHTHLLAEFVAYTLRLDALRNEDSTVVFPELSSIINDLKGS
jgi:sulfatase maturation enzyme AslB (radical SAM superfamily)